MAQHNELGKHGEELAQKHLREKGYQIVATNWHFGHEEIDIIAQDGNELVVVEVKTRSGTAFGEPEMAIGKQKIRSLVRCAEAFIETKNWNGDTRFDVIAVVFSGNSTKINHITNAYYPTM